MTVELSTGLHAPAAARRLAEAANRFLDSLSGEQRAAAQFPFAGDERYVWHYTPVDRNGLLLKAMADSQRDLALGLVDAAMSVRGAQETRNIIALEPILREAERLEGIKNNWHRDSERYAFSVFGAPGGTEPWGWRVGGHHVCLHFTVVGGELLSATPLFLGANPATVRHGPSAGLRTLPAEEDLARAFLASLEPAQRAVAIVDPVAPGDILTKNYRTVEPGMTPNGIRYGSLGGEQRERLVQLIRHYVERTADDLAAGAWSRIERGGLEAVAFAWAGPEERGAGHYYAVKGPAFLIEYDNTQNGGNHIHSVWRDYADDWGEDLLAGHYARDHQH